MNRWALCLTAACITAAAGAPALAQVPERTIDEIRIEAQGRAERGNYPLIGLDPADVRDALSDIHSRDPDEWAASWDRVADRYMADANASPDAARKDADYVRAWRLYYFGGWPVASSQGKLISYHKSLDAYAMHAKLMDPPLETIHIPFEGSEIVGYMRLPRAPMAPSR